jgi:hypothetical protein
MPQVSLGARIVWGASARGFPFMAGAATTFLHFLIIGKPAEFDACLLRFWKKPLAEKLSAPRAEPFALV